MTLNEETGMYSNAANEANYIVLAGNIYRVKKTFNAGALI